MSNYRVSIFGETYALTSDGSDDVLAAAQQVDAIMREIAMAHYSLDAQRIAVLAALRLAASCRSTQRDYERLTSLIDAEFTTPS